MYTVELDVDDEKATADSLNKTFVTAVGSVSSTSLPTTSHEDVADLNDNTVSRGESIFSEIESNLKSANEEEARVRKELEEYMNAIRNKRTDDGNNLVDFPSNYNDIVNMMTHDDVLIISIYLLLYLID